MWPDELPAGSVVVLGAADDLVHADEVGAGCTARAAPGLCCGLQEFKPRPGSWFAPLLLLRTYAIWPFWNGP